jgi:transcriptional regulator NrdR family protein
LTGKLEELKKKQKPINENLRKQLSDALSTEAINKEVKKSLKENIRYLFDELVRSRKDIDELRDEMKKLSDRQREL